MKKILSLLCILILSLFTLVGCSEKTEEKKEDTPLKVGVTAGPHEQIMQKVKELAEKQGLKIELVTFTDYIQPNVQLFEKDLDVNIYQHEPYLKQFNKDHKMDLIKVANTVNFPMGIYSDKIKSLHELKKGDSISLPSDPTNEARALMLLQEAKVIKLKANIGLKITINDIVENPKEIKFMELEAPMVPRSLSDVTAAAVNTNYAIEAKLNPVKDSIYIEPKNSPWVNIVAVRPEEKDNEKIKKLIEIYQSEETKKFIEDTFKGSVVTGF